MPELDHPPEHAQGSAAPETLAEALRTAEGYLRALLDSAQHPVLLLAPDCRLLRCNHAAEAAARRAIGRAIEAGDSIIDAVTPADRDSFAASVAQALGGQTVREDRPISSDRGVEWWELSFSPIGDPVSGVTGVVLNCQPIVERRAAEAQLRRSEQALLASQARLQLALDVAELGTWSWDLGSGAGSLDERGAAIVGLPPGPFPDAPTAQRDRVHRDDLALLEAQIAEGVAGGDDFSMAYRVIYPDGSVHHVASRARLFTDEDGRPRELVGTNRDVTAERSAEAALRTSESRQRFLLQLHDRLRPLTDPEAIQYEAACALGAHLGASRVGYAEDQGDGVTIAVTRNYTDGVPSIEGRYRYDDYGPELLRAFRVGRTVVRPDIANDATLTEAERRAHAVLQLGATLNVPMLKAGRLVGVLFMHQSGARRWTPEELTLAEDVAVRTWDAVERARTETRIERLYAQEQVARAEAEEASRLKDEFLATVSHELRTPLTAFLGYAQLLQARPRDAAYITRAVERMVRSAKAQAALIEDLLDISRIVSGKLRIEAAPVALADVVYAAVDTVRPAIEAKELRLRLDLAADVGPVVGDAGRLQQVAWNLLSNATKFTPPGGQITVELARAGEAAELRVRDSGQGIAAEFLPFVFDRFRQADSSSKRAYAGLGLGLAIVRHLVELHGGSVRAESAGAERGAVFTVRLPIAARRQPGPDEPAPLHDAPPAGEPLRGLRVLVVDDQPSILEVVVEMLELDGALVRTCASAREALGALREWRPDALVSDIAMPEQDGYWLIRRVRALPADAGGTTPALAITAYLRMDDRLGVLAAGFDGYLAKPVDAAELRDALVDLTSGPAPDR